MEGAVVGAVEKAAHGVGIWQDGAKGNEGRALRTDSVVPSVDVFSS